ncbi:MAG: twin-arginine translocation pathway signal protein [Pseudomonadota bacterium]
MTLSRRKMLALVGGGTILAAGGSAGAFIATRTPHAALEPWTLAGSYGEVRRDALSFALLAPNPHNRQPWVIDLVGGDTVVLYRDAEKDLPVTDPYGRQLTIGMGCFIELMEMAAAEMGYGVETVLFPEGEGPDDPVAICRFTEGTGQKDPLFEHVMERRSHKDAFDPTPVPSDAAAALSGFGTIVTEPKAVRLLGEIASEAWLIEMSTQDAYMESIDLLRIGKSEINAQPDGIDVGGPMMETLLLLGLLTHEAASDPNNPGSQGVIESTNNAILGAPAFVVQTTPGNSRIEQISAGRDWLRLNLATTALGLAVRPVSQALQEYPEVAEPYAKIHAAYAPDGGTVQMLGLLGYGAQPARTPRWKLDTKLRNA